MHPIVIEEGCLTIQDRTFLDGKLFAINEQYSYKATQIRPIKYNKLLQVCAEAKFYQVECNGIDYWLQENFVVPTTVKIPLEYQSFWYQFTQVFLQNKEHHDYREINNNCINCNQDIPHGDYNNNIETGGLKDPLLTGKN
jgi:tRNA U34 2-thiouridine synthase MnmA/TrmU